MTHATVSTDGIPSESHGHLVLWWWEQLCVGISWWRIVGLVGHHTAKGMRYGMPWKRPQPSSCRCRTSPHPTPSKHHSPIISCRATQMAWSSMTSVLEEFNDEFGGQRWSVCSNEPKQGLKTNYWWFDITTNDITCHYFSNQETGRFQSWFQATTQTHRISHL